MKVLRNMFIILFVFALSIIGCAKPSPNYVNAVQMAEKIRSKSLTNPERIVKEYKRVLSEIAKIDDKSSDYEKGQELKKDIAKIIHDQETKIREKKRIMGENVNKHKFEITVIMDKKRKVVEKITGKPIDSKDDLFFYEKEPFRFEVKYNEDNICSFVQVSFDLSLDKESVFDITSLFLPSAMPNRKGLVEKYRPYGQWKMLRIGYKEDSSEVDYLSIGQKSAEAAPLEIILKEAKLVTTNGGEKISWWVHGNVKNISEEAMSNVYIDLALNGFEYSCEIGTIKSQAKEYFEFTFYTPAKPVYKYKLTTAGESIYGGSMISGKPFVGKAVKPKD